MPSLRWMICGALLCVPAWAAAEPAAELPAESASAAASESDASLADSIVEGLSTYEPMYFAVGGDSSEVTARFQLSAQYRILRPRPPDAPDRDGALGRIAAVLDDVHVGYSQASVWDLGSPSAPFRDTSFRPALYYWNDDLAPPCGILQRFGLQAGLEHESNGKSGTDSRSINLVFLRPIATFGDPRKYHFTIAPKVYAYIEKEDNPDIPDFRGYVDLAIKFGKPDGLELTTTLRKGTRSSFGSVQADATFPIARLIPRLGAFLHVQYFYGYGETLLNYQRNVGSQIRAGLMIVPYGRFLP